MEKDEEMRGKESEDVESESERKYEVGNERKKGWKERESLLEGESSIWQSTSGTRTESH